MMSDVTRGIYREAAEADDADHRKALSAWARQSESKTKVEHALSLAEPRMSESLEQYDVDPYLIGLINGVYDLKLDAFRPGSPEDRITLSMNVAYDPKATCPRWEQFQLEIHDGNAAMVSFKQRALGYSLSGDVSEQKLFMCYGEGANGKTTEQNLVLHLQGEYAKKIEPETLLVRQRGGANNDVARMRGARLLATVEVEDGGKLAESLVKQLTGGDRLAARFMYQEFFEFRPMAKIWIATNHRPEITGTDYAIWRRILLVPYCVQFTKERRDPHLTDKLMVECPGIFNWMLEGYRQWAAHKSLSPPDEVLGATEDYRAEMDRVGNFLREVCKVNVNGRTPAAKVYRNYRNWMKANGLRPVSAKKFHERMERDHKLFRVQGDVSTYPGLLIVCHDYDYSDEVGF
jgi:putative DNA primase/helicase